jgi:riboflavin kinase / FMN adenylyltransferase
VRFEPLATLRGEQRFDSLDALKSQIVRDVDAARAVFAALPLQQPA